MLEKSLIDGEIELLSGLSKFFASIFNELPSKDSFMAVRERLLNPAGDEESGEEKEDDSSLGRGIALMRDFLASQELADEVVEALLVDWTRIFRGVSENYGPVPPFESAWLGESNALVDLAGVYAAEGLAIEGGLTTMPDYLGIQLAFVGHLLDNGKFEEAASFVAKHCGRWTGDFCKKALEYAKTDYYRGALEALHAFLLIFDD